jgi:hypothetical protein
MIEWGMKSPYDTLGNLIENVGSQIHADDGISLVEHVASLATHIPPTHTQARTLFNALFIDNSVIAMDLSVLRRTLLGFCQPWTDPDDTWYLRATQACIKANDPLTVDVLLSQPGAPKGEELSSKPLPNDKEGIVAMILRTHLPGPMWDIMNKYGVDWNLSCLVNGGVPLSYQAGAARTCYLLENGARLTGSAPDGKPVWAKVFRQDMDIEGFYKLVHGLANLANTNTQVRGDIQTLWEDLLPWVGTYLARKPYGNHHTPTLKALKHLSATAGVSMGGGKETSSVLAHWAHDMMSHDPDNKDTGTMSNRPLWKDLAKTLSVDTSWEGQCVPGVHDGVWGLLSDIQSTHSSNLTDEDIAAFIGSDPDPFWAGLEQVVLDNRKQGWAWDAVSRLRAHMPPNIRNSTCNAIGKSFFAALEQSPAEVSRKPRGGISVLTQCLKSVGKERDEFVDRELVSMALAAHMMSGWQSKAAIKAMERLAKDPPEWLDVPMIMKGYGQCPRKIRGAEARNLEAWLVSLNTERAQSAQRPGRRL